MVTFVGANENEVENDAIDLLTCRLYDFYL